MKMTREHFEIFKQIIAENKMHIDSAAENYANGEIINASTVKDIRRRFCMDMFYVLIHKLNKASKLSSSELYKYLNDDHIYTAMKRLLPNPLDLQK